MPNTIQYATIFQQELDKAFVREALTGWMDANTQNAKYKGGAEIKIPSITLQGLGNYDRTGGTGAPEGDITLTYETVKMTQDRGRGFTLDEMDVDETNFAATMGNVMGEFQRTQVVPEVDAYRLSTAAKLAATEHSRTYTPAAASILTELTNDLLDVQMKIGPGQPVVIHISASAYKLLINNEKWARQLMVGDFKKGEVSQQVRMLDSAPLIVTPDDLMQTKFDFKDGRSSEQEAGGFAKNAGAKQINWLILGRGCPIAPCKQDAVRVFDPNTYQKARAWHADYRKYHDLWIPGHKLAGVFANIGA